MTELSLRTTEMFGEVQTDIYENDNQEMFMTAEQIGECLEYSEPIIAINKLITRNDYLREAEFSVVTKLVSTDGKHYNTRVFNEDGIYEITMLAKTSKAKEFRCWVRRLLKSLRKGDVNLITKAEYSLLQNQIIEANKVLARLETKLTPTKPNYWLWKKHIVNPLVNAISTKVTCETRDVYDVIYDTMTDRYGFDRSFAINQMCNKYGTKEEFVIDAIADNPEYQRWFVDTANSLLNTYNQHITPILYPTTSSLDKVQAIIQPLAIKLQDRSVNYAQTYNKAYNRLTSKKGWKSLMTRTGCRTKKAVLLKRDDLFKRFQKCVNEMMEEV